MEDVRVKTTGAVAASRSGARSDISTRDQLPSLTGLRFWAALLVVLYHLTGLVGELPVLSDLARYGRTGVTFFFVLSGFVLAWTYLDRPTPYATFLWRRVARIWPLVCVTGLVSWLVFELIGVDVPVSRALTTFTFLQAWRPEWAVGANGAAWSLSDEFFFYAVFPVLLALAAVRTGRRLLAAATAVAIPVLWLLFVDQQWLGWRLDYWPVTRLVQFVAGVVAGVAVRRGARPPVGYPAAVALVVAYHAGLLVWQEAAAGMAPQWGPHSGSQWWSTGLFVLLIAAAADRDRGGRATGVTSDWSIRLGHWSFAWYLVHEIVVRVWVHHRPEAVGLAATAAAWTVLLVLSLAAAGLLYAFVEHPAERFLRARGPGRAAAGAHRAEPSGVMS